VGDPTEDELAAAYRLYRHDQRQDADNEKGQWKLLHTRNNTCAPYKLDRKIAFKRRTSSVTDFVR
jgi:hypothetical protein